MDICFYGCGKKAYFLLKNGRSCCHMSPNSCPNIKDKNSKSHRGNKHPYLSELNKQKDMKGENNPNFGKPGYWKGIKRPDHSDKIRGKDNPFWGKHHSEDSNRKNSESHKGEKNSVWNGGSSFLPYPPEFNKKLKEYIREKFNHTCILCKKWANVPHHIDYDKKNNQENNFVLLCVSCNGKVNKNRIQWEIYFRLYIELKNTFPT